LAEWLYEEGIGENRAILVEAGEIVEAAIELPDELRVGAVASGRLATILIPGRRGLVAAGKAWVLVEPLPATITQGQTVRVEIVREAIDEPGRGKHARGRITEAGERPGPTLAERIAGVSSDSPVGPDRFEEAGWSELVEEAISGEIAFPGGSLRMTLAPAMTLFDVDGALEPTALAIAGARAAGRAIRRLGIGGSIGIDLPTLSGRVDRQRAAAALDFMLPPPFERTAVNGFGFLQIVRRRERSSLAEIFQFDPSGAAARALLRRAERVPGLGARRLSAAPATIARIERNPAWLAELARRTGTRIELQADPSFATWAGHVQTVQS
jgi:hypothetical protein